MPLALKRRARLKSRSAAEESNLKIPDKVTEQYVIVRNNRIEE